MDDITPNLPEDEDDTPPEALAEQALFTRIKGWIDSAQPGFDRWRKEAEQDFAFVDGHQWTDEERAAMEEAGRPLLTYNELGPVIDVVVGSEINNRQEATAKPRDNTDSTVAEIAGDVIEFIRDDADADDAEGDAFRDNIIAGMGWNEIRPAADGSRQLMYYERVDPFEMRWPPGVTSKNLRDAPWLVRVRSIDRLAAEEMFPGENWRAIDAQWAKAHDGEPGSRDRREDAYTRDSAGMDGDAPDRVTVVEAQWIALEDVWRTPDPKTQQDTVIDAEMAAQLQAAPVTLPTGEQVKWPVRKTRERVAYRAFVGAQHVLEKVVLPTQQHGMTYIAQTGKWDRKGKVWYGIVRAARDPQRFANKYRSLTLEIIAAGAKGGLLAEADAFEDEAAAKRDWANPSAIVWLNAGGLAKVKERPTAQYPAGLDRQLIEARDAIRSVTGINTELLGLRDAQQPGILEHQRKQAAVTILAGYFDSLRRARKQGAEIVLALAISLFDESELARIVGPEKQAVVPALKQVAVQQFDIKVDESPQSANAKERTWAAIQPLLPLMANMGLPMEVWQEVLRSSPLPASMVERIIQHLTAAQQKEPDPAAQAMQQLTLEKAKADIAETAADTAKKQAETIETRLDAMIKAGEAHAAAGDRMQERMVLNGG